MKGISAVIATILMLMITIALAGMAYTYISGVFTARTSVILGISDAECTSTGVNVWVRNDGTATSDKVTVTIGTAFCEILAGVGPGAEATCKVGLVSPGAGYHTVRARCTGASARGSVYCSA